MSRFDSKENARIYMQQKRWANYRKSRAIATNSWIKELKEGQKCVDCHQAFPAYQLQFDHLPQYEKKFCISEGIKLGLEKEQIEKELEKCELVCGNCHAARTYRRATAKSA